MNTDNSTMKKNRRSPAFTLIELMTVMTVISILGAVAFPGIKAALRSAKLNAASQNARQIAFGLMNYAQENDGNFPMYNDDGDPLSTSNEVFRQLIPDYIDTERIFAVSSSAWGPRADGRIDETDERLEPGENHFAYISGLSQSATSDWPLVVDGTNGSGTYTRMLGEQGGCWEGRRGIMVTVGGSAMVVRLRGEGDERYLPRYGYPDENALETENYMGKNAQLLDPE